VLFNYFYYYYYYYFLFHIILYLKVIYPMLVNLKLGWNFAGILILCFISIVDRISGRGLLVGFLRVLVRLMILYAHFLRRYIVNLMFYIFIHIIFIGFLFFK
jgi:hypothetical protein